MVSAGMVAGDRKAHVVSAAAVGGRGCRCSDLSVIAQKDDGGSMVASGSGAGPEINTCTGGLALGQ